MFKPKSCLRFVLVVFAVACGACGGGGAGSDDESDGLDGSAGSVREFCDVSCAKEHDCDRRVDLQTCTNRCNGELGGSASKLRAEYVRLIGECYEAEDC